MHKMTKRDLSDKKPILLDKIVGSVGQMCFVGQDPSIGWTNVCFLMDRKHIFVEQSCSPE